VPDCQANEKQKHSRNARRLVLYFLLLERIILCSSIRLESFAVFKFEQVLCRQSFGDLIGGPKEQV
jgi:hypothetical protein